MSSSGSSESFVSIRTPSLIIISPPANSLSACSVTFTAPVTPLTTTSHGLKLASWSLSLRECTGTCAAESMTGPNTVLPPSPLGAVLASSRLVFRLSTRVGAFVFLCFLGFLWPPQLSVSLPLRVLPSTALGCSLAPSCAPILTGLLVFVLLTSACSPPFFLDFSCCSACIASSRSACAKRPLSTVASFSNFGAFRSLFPMAPEGPP